jgi:hypothetical protein
VPADLRRDSPFNWNTGTVTIWFGGFHSHEGSPKRIFYNGKSYQNGWFRSTLILGNLYFCWGEYHHVGLINQAFLTGK